MAILDKFHLFRKAIALVQLFSCLIVFTFSLILLIIGSITVGTANSTNDDFYQTTDYVSGGNLLITGGVFGILIAIVGAVGAVPCLLDRQDNLNLWVGLIVLVAYILVLSGVFIFEIAASSWAYNKWDTVSQFLQEELEEDIKKNYGITTGYTKSVDALQSGFSCCGIDGPGDWNVSLWRTQINNYTRTRIPSSCCSDKIPTTTVMPNMTVAPTNMTVAPTNSTNRKRRENVWRREINMNYTNTTEPVTMAPEIICRSSYSNSYKVGCWKTISDKLQSYTLSIAGVAIALAIIQLLILIVPIILLVFVVVELRRSKSLVIK